VLQLAVRSWWIFPLCLCLCGCVGTGSAALERVHRIATERSQVAEINRELRDISQIFLYAGATRSDAVGKLALEAAMRIVGEPEDCERELALALTASDVRKRSDRAMKLIKERSRCIKKISGNCDGLQLSVSELYASRRAVSIVLQLTLSLCLILLLAIILFRRL
jgi:hypothetical protein